MNWLVLWAALQIGVVPNSGIVTYNPSTFTLSEWTAYTQLEAEARLFGFAFIGGMVRTEIQKSEGLSFRPELSSYGFTAGIRFAMLEIGFLHVCQHPTVPYYSHYHPVINWDGWYEEIYLKVSGETKR